MIKKGYTLLETLIVVALFSLLFGIVFEILTTGGTSWNIGSTQQEVDTQVRQGLENMVKELYATNSGRSSITNDVPHPGSQIITFQVPVGYDVNGNIIWGADEFNNYSIRYTIGGNQQLLRQVLDASGAVVSERERVLANYVQSLNFTLANKILTITLTIQKTALGKRTLSRTLSSAVTLRN